MAKAAEEIKRIKAEAVAAIQAAEQWQARLTDLRRDNKRRLRLTALIMMTAALTRLAWEAAHTPEPPLATIQPLTGLAGSLPPHFGTQDDKASGLASNPQFSRALNRLRDAFHSFPEEQQENLVSQVNKKYSGGSPVCPLVWNQGVPALYVDEKEPPPWLAHAIDRCASEVEKLRAEKDLVSPAGTH